MKWREYFYFFFRWNNLNNPCGIYIYKKKYQCSGSSTLNRWAQFVLLVDLFMPLHYALIWLFHERFGAVNYWGICRCRPFNYAGADLARIMKLWMFVARLDVEAERGTGEGKGGGGGGRWRKSPVSPVSPSSWLTRKRNNLFISFSLQNVREHFSFPLHSNLMIVSRRRVSQETSVNLLQTTLRKKKKKKNQTGCCVFCSGGGLL